MIDFYGKQIPESLEELIEPKHTALLIWDMQNDVVEGIFNRDQIIQAIKNLLDECRKHGVKVVYSQHTTLDWRNESISWIRYLMKSSHVTDPSRLKLTCVKDTNGWKIVDEIKPTGDDFVFPKRRPSAFIGTDLDLFLRSTGISTVMIAGVATELGVESTVRHGTYIGYNMVIIRDCVGSWNKEAHEEAIKFMERRFEVVDSALIIQAWKQTVNM